MKVERVVATVGHAALEPAVTRRVRAIEHLIPRSIPVDIRRRLSPESLRIAHRLGVNVVECRHGDTPFRDNVGSSWPFGKREKKGERHITTWLRSQSIKSCTALSTASTCNLPFLAELLQVLRTLLGGHLLLPLHDLADRFHHLMILPVRNAPLIHAVVIARH